jgi:tRNA pseudouridine55 synthase
LIEYFPTDKRYVATAQLGFETLTLDRVGQVIAESPVQSPISDAALEAALQSQLGQIEQRVPRHSAVHYKGKKLYHYAHDGVILPEEELPIKTVDVFQLQASNIMMNLPHPTFKLHVHCGGGTYIRCLVRDIAKQLGTVGTMMALRRTQHGLFHEKEAIALATLEASTHPESYLQDPVQFLDLPRAVLKDETVLTAVLNGMPQDEHQFSLSTPPLKNNEIALLYAPDERTFIGLAMWHNERLRPKKIMHTLPQPSPQPSS